MFKLLYKFFVIVLQIVLTALVHLLIVPNYALLNTKETSKGTPLYNLIG